MLIFSKYLEKDNGFSLRFKIRYFYIFDIILDENLNGFVLLCFNQKLVLNILVNKRLAALFLANRTFLKSL
jgi:hypothetical protein